MTTQNPPNESSLIPNSSRCGMVSIIGRPNSGKSTLLNALVGEKIAIVSKVPQTTRHRIRGVFSNERGQIVFIDTPGLFLGKDRLDKFLIHSATSTLTEVDCVIYLVDTSKTPGPEEDAIVERLAKLKIPIVLGLNKIDLGGKCLPLYISLWEKAKGSTIAELKDFVMLPLSGKTEANVEKLRDIVFDFLPVGPLLYPTDVVTDVPQRIAVSDIIREKFLMLLREELPHSIAVEIDQMTRKKRGVTHILSTVYVERESQKEIVIGKGGSVLKKVGTQARLELERLLEGKVFLELHVKLKEKWRDNLEFLTEMGYEG